MANAIKCDDSWEVEEDLRTLCRAKEIKADPKRMKKCKDLAQKKMQEMGAVAGSDD